MIRSIIISVLILAISFSSCNEDDKDTNQTVKNDTVKKHVVKVVTEANLIDIPVKISEETSRTNFSSNIVSIDVFNAGVAMNEGLNLLLKMFPNAKIEYAEASEVFDSFNIAVGNKKYCSVITYGKNTEDEFVIKTIFIAKDFFSEDIINEIYE